MLSILLVDTALELVPSSLQSSNCYQSNLAKFGVAGRLLDTSLHHTVMHELNNSDARGRPDILHHYLLDALGSPANVLGKLQIYFEVGTRVYQVDPQMRCPRDYLRFKALMVQLLDLGHIPPESPYFIAVQSLIAPLWIKNNFLPDNVIKFSRLGDLISYDTLCSWDFWHQQDVVVLIGGFQKGHFSDWIMQIQGRTISLGTYGLDSWVVVNRILAAYEVHLKKK
jgi:rRNA small subunit pseudouridine methyltransferase Nep1